MILLLAFNEGQIPIPCGIVGESAFDVRIRVTSGLEVELRKSSILAVEEDRVLVDSRID